MFRAVLATALCFALNGYMATIALALPTSSTTSSVISLLDISIQELSSLLENHTISSWTLVHHYLDRIEEVNNDLHAVIEVNRHNALRQAMRRDSERRVGLKRGPLHGIPILVKDNFATLDGLTGSGSSCLARLSVPKQESTVIQKLRRAGAIILGKTNLSEFAGGRGLNAPEGWSPRGGQTLGAYVENQTACGSSSGSGVAASLGLAAGTLGTETAGSITCPAFFNNVVGIKPTVGLASRYGIVPLTHRQDTPGPLAQSVADAALLLDAIVGKDNFTLAQPWDEPPSYVSALNASALLGKRIGVLWSNENILDETLNVNMPYLKVLFDEALVDLEAAGAQVIDVELDTRPYSMHDYIDWLFGNVTVYEIPDFRDNLDRYMTKIAPGPGSNISQLLPCMQTDILELAWEWDITFIEQMALTNISSGSEECWQAYTAAVRASRDLLLKPLEAQKLDALVLNMDLAVLVTAAPGLPIVTVPMGALGKGTHTILNPQGTALLSAPGMPAGLTFTAEQWSEEKLIGMAYAYEQISQKRKTLDPWIKPHTDLHLPDMAGKGMEDWNQEEL
jgi:amidase